MDGGHGRGLAGSSYWGPRTAKHVGPKTLRGWPGDLSRVLSTCSGGSSGWATVDAPWRSGPGWRVQDHSAVRQGHHPWYKDTVEYWDTGLLECAWARENTGKKTWEDMEGGPAWGGGAQGAGAAVVAVEALRQRCGRVAHWRTATDWTCWDVLDASPSLCVGVDAVRDTLTA
jgi:hypothetical protein